jgi:copper chaperone CopZ
VPGVLSYKTSYALKNSLVTFDKSKVDVETIEAAINKTGYTVKEYKLISEKK